MWIFLIELIERSEELPAAPITQFSIGLAPPEDSRGMDETEFGSDFAGSEFDEDDDNDPDDDDFNEFEDGYNEEDYQSY
jgi:hypothetical protein